MTWANWIATVIAIGQRKGLQVRVEYPGPGLATFYWSGIVRRGVAGAGVAMYQLTDPDVFTRLWYDEPPAPVRPLDAPGGVVILRGRFVPRVPAMAVSDAIQELFK